MKYVYLTAVALLYSSAAYATNECGQHGVRDLLGMCNHGEYLQKAGSNVSRSNSPARSSVSAPSFSAPSAPSVQGTAQNNSNPTGGNDAPGIDQHSSDPPSDDHSGGHD